jgi:hypothetical protein
MEGWLAEYGDHFFVVDNRAACDNGRSKRSSSSRLDYFGEEKRCQRGRSTQVEEREGRGREENEFIEEGKFDDVWIG